MSQTTSMPLAEKKNRCLPGLLTKSAFCKEVRDRVSRISREFTAAFELIQKYPRSVSIFGSSRAKEEDEHYREARRLASRITRELGYAIITGGGEGIMEAANRGAFEAGGTSIGLNIKLPQRHRKNTYTTESLDFYYFFVRKVALSFAAETYIFFPGGFGTLDEFFEIITLIQTRKIRGIPIFLMGKDYWEPLDRFIKENLLELHRAIDPGDRGLYHITDDEEEVIKTIRAVPIRS